MNRKYTPKKMCYKGLLTVSAIMTLFFCSEVSANASAKDVHELSEVCMNVQRALKDYALIGMGVDYQDPKADLNKSLKSIDDHFKELKNSKLSEKLATKIFELETSWKEIQPQLQKEPFTQTIMHELHEEIDEEYSDRCEKIVDELATDTGIKGEHYVIQVAQLGMESQRLAAIYLLRAWGIDDPHYDKVVKHVLDGIDNIYKELMAADEKLVSLDIKEKLKATKKEFAVFGVMTKSTTGRFMPVKAAKMASNLFEIMQEILHMEKELVEGSVSGYFLPIATEGNAGGIFEKITQIVYTARGEAIL
ncbi:MAG: hypothetical protein D3923_04560 [Candidatus Electrothrix sp. AR3]|nr:hypothetical protein [Candidatus Electrothrix sp. AR3]